MLNKNTKHDLIKEVENNLIKTRQTRAEKLLNPNNEHLSSEAKKRLKWLYPLLPISGKHYQRFTTI
jgi:hypothetical protein